MRKRKRSLLDIDVLALQAQENGRQNRIKKKIGGDLAEPFGNDDSQKEKKYLRYF